jgi:hypothetical protein
MEIYCLDSIRSELESSDYIVKFLAHDRAVVFFPASSTEFMGEVWFGKIAKRVI